MQNDRCIFGCGGLFLLFSLFSVGKLPIKMRSEGEEFSEKKDRDEGVENGKEFDGDRQKEEQKAKTGNI